MIDWAKLRTYQNDKRKSFEELCYQVANRLYGDRGDFTSIDDSGGGDGVEFFLSLPDGTEWGWQAKFYFPQPRLDRSRKRSIETSLSTTLSSHPNLKKWFLCTPTNFTNRGEENELNWFKNKLQGIAQDVELTHWGDSDFLDMLSDPQMVGKRLYFFGELELTQEWFAYQVRKQIANVSDKFFPGLHAETSIDDRVHLLLGDEKFLERLSYHLGYVITKADELNKAEVEVRRYVQRVGWAEDAETLLGLVPELAAAVAEAHDFLSSCLFLVKEGRLLEVNKLSFGPVLKKLEESADKYDDAYRGLAGRKLSSEKAISEEDREAREQTRSVLDDLRKPFSLTYKVLDNLGSADEPLRYLRQRELHVFGSAGIGKTHLTCHFCSGRTQAGRPALLLLGGSFSTATTIEKKILEILDIPASYSWSDLLGALEAFAEAHKTKVLIAIDALNEAASVDVWRNGLRGFASTILTSPWLVLVTTCRSSYRAAIWDDKSPSTAIDAYGLTGDSLEEAIDKYFEYYKLKADLTFAPLAQFSHPLYLKLFCEAQNPERLWEKEVYVGQQTLFEVFDMFLEQASRALCWRLSKVPSSRIVEETLSKLAEVLWEHNARHVTLQQAHSVMDGASAGVEWGKSLTKAMLDEGLLISRDWVGDEDVVTFTYDLLGGYLVSKVILKDIGTQEVEDFVNSPLFKARFLSANYGERHPLHEDIVRCLCALLPERTGVHMYTLTQDEAVFTHAITSLFEMRPSLIREEQAQELIRLFDIPKNRRILLPLLGGTAANVGHPLNANFIHSLLSSLTMPERDVSWSEHVRSRSTEFLQAFRKFERACRKQDLLGELDAARLELTSRFIMWALTSTHRLTRDTATRALYWYGRRYPQKLFDETLTSLAVNDPYVPERMLAASYGVAMALHADPAHAAFREVVLPNYALKLFDGMFSRGAAHATTHALMRDYARHTIELALLHHPKLLNANQRKRIRPPFRDGGIRKWGRSVDLDEGRYSGGDAPIQMDFSNYTLGRLIPNRRNYDFKHRGYQNVLANIYWRIYDLGYKLETFSEIDKEIQEIQWGGRQPVSGRVDRYGKKYSWIAYFELYGFREDKKLLKSRFGGEDKRPTDVDIDPSFPDEPPRIQLIFDHFLGDRNAPLREWVEDGGLPDLTPYLVMDEVHGEGGPWVLISGYVNQVDEDAKRRLHSTLQCFFVNSSQQKRFLSHFHAKTNTIHHLFELPSDYYTFAGETAWSDTFPSDARFEVYFDVGTRKKEVPYKELAFFRDGTRLPEAEESLVMAKIRAAVPRYPDLRPGHVMMAVLKREQLDFKLVEGIREEEETVTRKHNVFIPVRENNWESYHSELNPAQGAIVPARELAEALGLWIKLPTWDMYDGEGRRATITSDWGEIGRDRQQVFYLRQDLLDTFLRRKKLALVWILGGEREIWLLDEEERHRLLAEVRPHYKYFRQGYSYKNGKVSVHVED